MVSDDATGTLENRFLNIENKIFVPLLFAIFKKNINAYGPEWAVLSTWLQATNLP